MEPANSTSGDARAELEIVEVMLDQKWKYRPDVVAETMEGIVFGSELYLGLWRLVGYREKKGIAYKEMAYWVMRNQLRDYFKVSQDAIDQLRQIIEKDQEEIREFTRPTIEALEAQGDGGS